MSGAGGRVISTRAVQISCPQCATSYELDERLLPVHGAPVQCTRCAFVFTATPPKRDENKTQIFGMPSGANSDDRTSETPPPPSERTNLYGRTAPLPGGAIPMGTVQYGSPVTRKTQMFGAGDAATEIDPSKHAGESRSEKTQIFGLASAEASARTGDSAPRTMMFGSADADASNRARGSSSHKTQIFGSARAGSSDGAPGSGAGADGGNAAANASESGSHKTQIFGSARAGSSDGAPGSGAGAEGGNAAANASESGSHKTQVFGSARAGSSDGAPGSGAGAEGGNAAANASESGSHKTQVFGSARAESSDRTPGSGPGADGGDAVANTSESRSNKTQIFGLAGADASARTGDSPRATMMFGSAESDAANRVRESGSHKTQIFGSARADASDRAAESGPLSASVTDRVDSAVDAREARSNKTQIFGMPGGDASMRTGEVARTTMMFGSADADASNRAHESGSNKTKNFGSTRTDSSDRAPGSAPAADGGDAAANASETRSNKTQIFGLAGGDESMRSGDAARSTMIFGRETAPDAASSGAVDAPNSAQTPPAGLPGGTMIFGRPGAAPRATQAYGPAASAPGDDAARATQRLPSFPPSEPAREVPPNQLPQYDDSIADEDGADASVPFDARATVLDPMPAYPRRSPADPGVSNPLSSAADPAPGAKPQSPDGAAPAWIPPAARRTTGTMPVPARPLEPFTPPTLGAPNPDASLLIDDGTTALINARNRRRNFVLGVFAILVIGTAGYFGYDRWSKRERPPPPEVVAAAQEGVTALRRDDPKSLEAASAAEQALVASHPRYVDARVQLLTALLFQYDDLRMQLQHAKQRSGTLTTQIAQLKERRSPGDWQNRVNAMVDELREIKKQTDPLVDRAADLERRINDELRSIQQLVPDEAAPQRRVQRVRAEALYFGIKGADEAIALSERYRLLGGKEGWGDVAFAEYALNAHVAPQTRRQAREALEALKAKDNSWVRLYVLIGRLALADKDFDIANTAFESALTLNPEHEPARRMLRQLEQERADQ